MFMKDFKNNFKFLEEDKIKELTKITYKDEGKDYKGYDYEKLILLHIITGNNDEAHSLIFKEFKDKIENNDLYDEDYADTLLKLSIISEASGKLIDSISHCVRLEEITVLIFVLIPWVKQVDTDREHFLDLKEVDKPAFITGKLYGNHDIEKPELDFVLTDESLNIYDKTIIFSSICAYLLNKEYS